MTENEGAAVTENERMQILRANSAKAVRIESGGHVFFGDEEFMWPILKGSLKIEPISSMSSKLTMTLLINGGVTVVPRERPVEEPT